MIFFPSFGLSFARLTACVAIGLALPSATAQTTTPAWQASIDGQASGDDIAVAVALLPSGNVAVAGMSQHEPTPGVFVPQFLTAVYTPQGALVWSRTHGSGFQSNGFARKIAITPAGKIVTAGTRDDGANWMLVQYDALGTLEWEGVWLAGSTTTLYVADLDVDLAGNIYICGDVSAAASVAKFSPSGTLLWSRSYVSGPELTSIQALGVNTAGDVFVAGSTSNGAGALQFSVARIDPGNGAQTWIRKDGPTGPASYSLAQVLTIDDAGRVIAGGRLMGPTFATSTLSFRAYLPDGTLAWQHDQGGPTVYDAGLADIVAGASGVVAAAGWTVSPQGDPDGYVIRLNGGAFAWEQTISGSAQYEDASTSVTLDAFGNVYAGAYVQEIVMGAEVRCYSPNGVELGRGRAVAPGQGGAITLDLALGVNGRSYLVGYMNPQPGVPGDALAAAFDISGVQPGAFCFGDTSGAACPCANFGSVGNGCANSLFAGGSAISRIGNAGASASTDALVLAAESLSGPVLFFQGSGLLSGTGTAFGDGILCVGGGIVRLGVVFPTAGAASYPGGLTPQPIHVAGATAAGDVRHYQCWYRDAISFCTAATFNLTPGLTVLWGP